MTHKTDRRTFVKSAIAVPAAILSAVKAGSWFDLGAAAVSFIGLAIPGFWLGIMLILLFAVSALGYVLGERWTTVEDVLTPPARKGEPPAGIVQRERDRRSPRQIRDDELAVVADRHAAHPDPARAPPLTRAASIISDPAVTSASLLASNMRLPARTSCSA